MGIDWKVVPGTNDNLRIGVDWHESQNDDNYFISPEIYRYDYYYTDNFGGNYWETLYKNDGTTNEWGPYSWGSGSGERSIDTFTTYTYTRKDSSYAIYLTISWDSSTGAVYNGSFHSISADSLDFWITIPAKEKKTITLKYYNGDKLWKTESKEILSNVTTNVYFPEIKPTKDGYKFAGWKIGNTIYAKDKYFSVTNPDNVISIYAQWDKIYDITFVYDDKDKININKTFHLTAGNKIDLNKEFGVQSKITSEIIKHTYITQTDPNNSSLTETKIATRTITTTKNFIDWKTKDEKEQTKNGAYIVTKDITFTKPIWTNLKTAIVDESITLPETQIITSDDIKTSFLEEVEETHNNESNKYTLSLWFKGEQEATPYTLTKIKRKITITNFTKIYKEAKERKWEVSENEDFSSIIKYLSPKTICKVDNESNKTFYVRQSEKVFTKPVEINIRIEEPETPIYKDNSEELLGIYLTPQGESTKTNKFSGWIYSGKLIESGTEYYLSTSEMTKDSNTENSYILGSKESPKLTVKLTPVIFQPQILNFTLMRCKKDGSLDDDGVYAKITGALVQTQPYADSSIKPKVVTLKVKINDEDSEKSGVTFYRLSNNTPPLFDYGEKSQSFSYCLELPKGGFLVDSQYKVELVLSGSDNIWSVSATDYLTQSFFTIDFLAGGTGLSIGAPSSSSGFINNMETSCTQGFAIYPPQKKNDGRDIVVTGGRNLVKQKDFVGYVATVEIPETGTYSISSDVEFIVKKDEIPLTPDIGKDTTKYTFLSLEGTITISSASSADEQNFKDTLKVEKGPSCSAYTPAPEDGATFFVDKDQINLLNSDIVIRKDNNIVALDYHKEIALNYKNSISLNCNMGATLNGDVTLASGVLKIKENSGAQIIATSAVSAETAESATNAKTAESATNAKTANKLSISTVGVNNKQPVYFSNGTPVAWTTPIADYIVAQGKCDFWTYRMWASGVAECWGQTSSTTVSVSSSWGSLYDSGTGHTNGFPGNTSLSSLLKFSVTIGGTKYTKLFTSIKHCDCNFISSDNAFIVETGSGLSNLQTPQVFLLRATSGDVTGKYSYRALGTWKVTS